MWFSKWCCWRLKFSEIWQCVFERVVRRIRVPSSSGLKSPRRLMMHLPWSFKLSHPRQLDSSKVKLSLSLVKTTSWRYVESGGVASHILQICIKLRWGQLHILTCFTPGERSGSNSLESWVKPSASLGIVSYRSSHLPGIRLWLSSL